MNLENELRAVQSGNSENIIEHYGVKGMKWGTRKFRQKLALRKQQKTDKRVSKERNRQWSHKYANRASMSNHDLQRAVTRLRLENDLAEQVRRTTKIHEKPKSSFAKELGKELVKDTVKNTGRLATKAATSYVKGNPAAIAGVINGVKTWMNT